MPAFSRQFLSESTNGLPIPVGTTSTDIHTAAPGTAGSDEIDMWASNTTGSAITLTVEWGGVTDPDDLLTKDYSIPANSAPTRIAEGQLLNNGLTISAKASAVGINMTGRVLRIS